MFHVGQKVVCVNDSSSVTTEPVKRRDGNVAPLTGGLDGLRRNAVYTVVDIDPPSYPEFCAESELVLAEIDRGHPIIRGFRASRFRPVVERKTRRATDSRGNSAAWPSTNG